MVFASLQCWGGSGLGRTDLSCRRWRKSGLSDRVLSNQELRSLQGRSNLRGGVRLAIHVALSGGAGWLVVVVSPGWVT